MEEVSSQGVFLKKSSEGFLSPSIRDCSKYDGEKKRTVGPHIQINGEKQGEQAN